MRIGIVTILDADKKERYYVRVSFGYVYSCDKNGIYSFCQKVYGALQFETYEEALYVCERVHEQSEAGQKVEWLFGDPE